MFIEIERVGDADDVEAIRRNVVAAVADVRAAVTDWSAMKAKMLAIAGELPEQNLPFDRDTIDAAAAFLRWAADDHFPSLGYRAYRVERDGEGEVLKAARQRPRHHARIAAVRRDR